MTRSPETGSRARGVVLAWAAFSAACIAVFSCAQATERDEFEGIGTGGAPSTSSVGAGSTGTQGGAATSSPAATGSGQGGGGMCEEQPCKLVSPQCGCPSGQQCVFQNGQRSCVNDGADEPGDECSGYSCKAGAMCLTLGSLSTCRKFCNDDTDCSGFGGICVMKISGFEEPTDPTFCSDNCDPPSGTGCPTSGKCELGLADDMVTFFTMCGSAGAGTQGASCMNTWDDCAGGFGCFNTGDPNMPTLQCLAICNTATPNCPSGTACVGLNPPAIIGSIEYGACL